MDDLNSVTLIGRLTRDPELRSTGSGMSVCSFRLAFNTSKKTQNGWEDKGNFIGVTVWGTQGESVARFTKKGSQVAIKGRLEFREWTSKSGDTVNAIELVADRVQFIGPKADDGDAPARSSSRSTSRVPVPAPADDDIPF